jgi:ubiquinone/menaquinone biosynthesis C-methylase UbiE
MEAASSGSADARVSPQPILDAAWSFAVTRVLATAVELDLFTWIARDQTTVEELARTTSCPARGLAMLLNALTALRYLEARGGRYGLSPVSAAYLTKTSSHYIGTYLLHNTTESWPLWAQLSDVVRRGTPARHSVHGDQADVEFFSQLVQSLHRLGADAAAVAARALRDGIPETATRVLDVAAGSAVWSLALAKDDPQALVTVVDLPEVVDRVSRQFVDQEGFSDRFTFWPGDLRQMDFGESAFDIVILGHICHGEGAEGTQALIRQAYRALRSGGQILIADFVPDEDRCGPLMPLLFAIHMLVLTDNGDSFTLAEYQTWLLNAGFAQVRPVPAPAPSPLILATKP